MRVSTKRRLMFCGIRTLFGGGAAIILRHNDFAWRGVPRMSSRMAVPSRLALRVPDAQKCPPSKGLVDKKAWDIHDATCQPSVTCSGDTRADLYSNVTSLGDTSGSSVRASAQPS